MTHPLSLGTTLLIDKVIDEGDGHSFYPPLLLEWPFATSKLITVSVPENKYEEDAAYDMEGSAFCLAASSAMNQTIDYLSMRLKDLCKNGKISPRR